MASLGISVDDRDGVRHVVIDRPDKKNALTAAMSAALADAVSSAGGDGIGALLLRANGTTFTAGNDLRDFLENPPHGAAVQFREELKLAQLLTRFWKRCGRTSRLHQSVAVQQNLEGILPLRKSPVNLDGLDPLPPFFA